MSVYARSCRALAPALTIGLLLAVPAAAQPLALSEPYSFPGTIFQQIIPSERMQPRYEAMQPRYETTAPADDATAQVPAHLRRQVVPYRTSEPAGTIVVDTANTYLYLVMGGGRALRYGIGVGREGFTWSGTRSVERKTEWPDWHPPAEMIERQPYLPRFMAGGPGNPLGARALYIGGTLYRIHGTNQPTSIGQKVSSGCIRMLNEDVIDLYQRVNVGSRVVVLPDARRASPANVARRAIVTDDDAVYASRAEAPAYYRQQRYNSASRIY